MMSQILNYCKYSGIWFGVVVNPFHWQFGWNTNQDNVVHLGPIWLRVVIDDGQW